MDQPAKRIKREELYEAVWSRTLKALAQEWNTTYVQLVLACEEMEVPRPGPAHWPLIARGYQIEKEPLLQRRGGIPGELVLLPQGARQEKRATARGAVAVAKTEREEPDAPKAVERQEVGENAGAIPGPTGRRQESDLPQAVERAVLDIIRQATRIDFWRETISECHQPCWLADWLGLEEGVKVSEARLLSLLKNSRKEYRSFQVKVVQTKDRYNPCETAVSVEIGLREGYEWKDAWEEAGTFAENPNPHCLSDNALRLYQWAKGPKNTGTMTDRRKIGAQARLRKTYSDIEDHLREIRLKADSGIRWAEEKKNWHGQMRVWFEKGERVFYRHGPLNPALGLNVREFRHAELERFKQWLYDEILKPGFPEGTETVGVFDIRDRKTLKAVFSRLPDDCGSYGPLPDFFEALRLLDGLEIRYEFEDGREPWLVICQLQPGANWKEIKARLAAKAKEIPLEKRYALDADARALLQWILDLRRDEYLLGLTPPVEDHLERDIGIETELGEENVRTYVELLVEEINERTEFNLRTIGWHHYGKELTRLLVRKKRADLEGIVRSVQALGLSKHRVLDGDKVRAVINGLVGGG